MRKMMTRKITALVLVACATTTTGSHRAQAQTVAEFSRAEEAVAAFARTAAVVRQKTRIPDAPGVRETVHRLAVHVSRTCGGASPRYALQPVSADLGPSLSAYAEGLKSDYFYPDEANLRLELAGDGPGAAVSIRSEQGPPRPLGTIAPEEGPCRPYSSVLAVLQPAAGVSATISVEPRTGFLRPACYKDPVNGLRKLDTWTILALVFPQETMTVKTADGMSFRDKQSCLDFYERAASVNTTRVKGIERTGNACLIEDPH